MCARKSCVIASRVAASKSHADSPGCNGYPGKLGQRVMPFRRQKAAASTYNLYTILSANFENLALLSAKKVGLGRPVNVALDSTMKK